MRVTWKIDEAPVFERSTRPNKRRKVSQER